MRESSCEKTNAFSIEEASQSSNLMRNLRSVIEAHQNESAKNFGMSIIYLLNDEHDKMLECLYCLLQSHPEVALIHRRIAEVYISRDDYEAAVAHLEKALKLNKEDLTAKVWLGLSYYATGNEKKAKICLNLLKDDIFLLHAANTNWFEQSN